MNKKLIFKDGTTPNFSYPKSKQGISLIVLVITIIVMIILAGAIILTLSNSGIMDKASQAVSDTNIATIKEVANMAWAQAYVANLQEGKTELDAETAKRAIEEAFEEHGIKAEDYEAYEMNITNKGVEFVNKEEVKLNHTGIIPEGATYYRATGVAGTDDLMGYPIYEHETINAGEAFPATPTTGDIYVYGDYEYRYNQYQDLFTFKFGFAWQTAESQNGWAVKIADNTKTTCGVVLESINGKMITRMDGMYYRSAITTLPDDFVVPSSVTSMMGMFIYSKITTLPDGFNPPSNVTGMWGMFYGCSNLSALPANFTIPSNVEDVNQMFFDCTNLTSLSNKFIIPSNVKIMDSMFWGCSFLSATVTINANPTRYNNCFTGVKAVTLTGTSTMLQALAETDTNGNVTVAAQ